MTLDKLCEVLTDAQFEHAFRSKRGFLEFLMKFYVLMESEASNEC